MSSLSPKLYFPWFDQFKFKCTCVPVFFILWIDFGVQLIFTFLWMPAGWIHSDIIFAKWEPWFSQISNKYSAQWYYWSEWNFSVPGFDYGMVTEDLFLVSRLHDHIIKMFQKSTFICSFVFSLVSIPLSFLCLALQHVFDFTTLRLTHVNYDISLIFVGWKYWWERICWIIGTRRSKVTSKGQQKNCELDWHILKADTPPIFCFRFLVAADHLWERRLHYVCCACTEKIQMLSM
jgi:hypothetical protein